MKKPFTTLALSAALILAPASAALATVDTTPSTDTTVEQSDDGDNTGLWGLLGWRLLMGHDTPPNVAFVALGMGGVLVAAGLCS